MLLSSKVTGKCIKLNPAFTDLSGYTPEETIGKNAGELQLYADLSDRHRMVAELSRQGRLANQEVSLRIKSGKICTVLTNVEPVLFYREECLLTTMQDITELRWTEKELREAASYDRKLFNLGPTARYIARAADWVIVQANTAVQAPGYSPETIIGQDARVLVSIENEKEWQLISEHFAAHGNSAHGFELKMKVGGGAPQWFSVNSDIFEDRGERFILFEFVNIDSIKKTQLAFDELNRTLEQRVQERTTALSQSNAKPEHANSTKDEFLSTMSHELRTPLCAILSRSELLKEGTYG